MQAGFTNMLTIVFGGVVLQPVMVLALVGCKRVFKVVLNTEVVSFGPAPRLSVSSSSWACAFPPLVRVGTHIIEAPQGVLRW